MYDITKTFTIQWVGPFRSYEDMKSYLGQEGKCGKELFNFYFFSGNKYGKGRKPSSIYRYFGIHKKADGIDKRLNNCHSHFKDFRKNEKLRIWIGAFGNVKDQKERNIEDAETLFIRTYGNEVFTENRKKVKSVIRNSICIVNLFYKEDETPWYRKPQEILFMDDVLIHETEEQVQRTLVAKLRTVKWK